MDAAWWTITLVGTGGAMIAWLLNRSISQIDESLGGHDEILSRHTDLHAKCSLELSQFKTEVANNYAKEATMQSSLERIHDRIDDVAKDIKQLLRRGI